MTRERKNDMESEYTEIEEQVVAAVQNFFWKNRGDFGNRIEEISVGYQRDKDYLFCMADCYIEIMNDRHMR